MKKNGFRLSAAILAAVMAAGVLGACSNSGSSTPPSSVPSSSMPSSSQTSSAKPAEPLSFKVTTVSFGDSPDGKLIQETWLEKCSEAMGRELKPQFEYIHNLDYGQKLKIICAGGEIPDLLSYGWDTQANLIKFGEQGLFEELTQHMDQMPNFKRVFDSYSSADTLLSSDGKLYAFYGAVHQPDGNNQIVAAGAIRKDILDDLNLDIPETIDDLTNAARAMKQAYPDKYPIIVHEEWQQPDITLYAANHTYNNTYYNGSEYVYGPLEDAYKEVLMEMNKWYTEGLISPDYFTHTSENGTASVANGDAMVIPGIWPTYPGRWETAYPDQEWILLPSLRNDKYGDPWSFLAGSTDEWTLNALYSVVVSAKSKVKDEMLQLMDLQYSDEIVDLLAWGIEGETYEINSDGEKHMTEYYMADTKRLAEIAFGTYTCRPAIFPQPMDLTQTAETQAIENIWYKGQMYRDRPFTFVQKNYDPNRAQPSITIDALTTDEMADYANIMTAVHTFCEEQKVKFIKGERSFDEWDSYLEEAHKMGDIAAAMEFMNSKIKK